MIHRTRSRFRLLVVLAVLGGVAATTASADRASHTATVEWKMMTVAPPPSTKVPSIGNFLKAFSDDVYKQTNGQLRITIYSPGALPYTNSETLATVGRDLVQVGDGAAFLAGESKAAGIGQLPFLIRDVRTFEKVAPTLLPYLKPDFDRYGVRPLFYYSWPGQVAWGTGNPITSLATFAERKLRVSSAQQSEAMSALKGSPVTLGPTEVVPALQRGVVDGVFTAGVNAYAAGWGQFLKWGFLLPLNVVPSPVVVNKDAFNSLPADVRTTLTRVAAKWQKQMLKKIPRMEAISQKALSTQFGVRLVKPSAADVAKANRLMRSYYQSWAKSNGLQDALTAVQKKLAVKRAKK